eukprot:sb/3476344/
MLSPTCRQLTIKHGQLWSLSLRNSYSDSELSLPESRLEDFFARHNPRLIELKLLKNGSMETGEAKYFSRENSCFLLTYATRPSDKGRTYSYALFPSAEISNRMSSRVTLNSWFFVLKV